MLKSPKKELPHYFDYLEEGTIQPSASQLAQMQKDERDSDAYWKSMGCSDDSAIGTTVRITDPKILTFPVLEAVKQPEEHKPLSKPLPVGRTQNPMILKSPKKEIVDEDESPEINLYRQLQAQEVPAQDVEEEPEVPTVFEQILADVASGLDIEYVCVRTFVGEEAAEKLLENRKPCQWWDRWLASGQPKKRELRELQAPKTAGVLSSVLPVTGKRERKRTWKQMEMEEEEEEVVKKSPAPKRAKHIPVAGEKEEPVVAKKPVTTKRVKPMFTEAQKPVVKSVAAPKKVKFISKDLEPARKKDIEQKKKELANMGAELASKMPGPSKLVRPMEATSVVPAKIFKFRKIGEQEIQELASKIQKKPSPSLPVIQEVPGTSTQLQKTRPPKIQKPKVSFPKEMVGMDKKEKATTSTANTVAKENKPKAQNTPKQVWKCPECQKVAKCGTCLCLGCDEWIHLKCAGISQRKWTKEFRCSGCTRIAEKVVKEEPLEEVDEMA